MIKEIIFLVGLPGSGKSTLGQKLKNEKEFEFLDDLSVLTENAEIYLSQYLTKKVKGLIIADCPFCEEETLKAAENLVRRLFPKATLNIIYFENNVEKCFKNIESRAKKGDTRRVSGYVVQLSKVYSPPEELCLKIIT